MVDISDIKSKAQALRNRVSSDGDDQLGPDRGTMDQLEARKERARMEARQAAKKEKREQEVNQAREQGREEVFGDSPGSVFGVIQSAVDAVDDGDRESLDDFATAMQTDFDGDGEPFGAEIGLQTELEAEQRQRAENQTFQQLSGRVSANENDIQDLDAAFGARGDGQQSSQSADPAAGFDGTSLEDMGFGSDDDQEGLL